MSFLYDELDFIVNTFYHSYYHCNSIVSDQIYQQTLVNFDCAHFIQLVAQNLIQLALKTKTNLIQTSVSLLQYYWTFAHVSNRAMINGAIIIHYFVELGFKESLAQWTD